MLTDFHNFSCTTSQENAKVIGIKIYCHTLVMLLPYRVKVSDTKVTHFTPILALCTCLYRSHLGQPVSMTQAKHSRKSEAQNLCSKCPPFTRTHAFKRLCHCAIATMTLPACTLTRPDGVHGAAASTPSADVLSTPSHYRSASGRPSLEAYPRCCSPPD